MAPRISRRTREIAPDLSTSQDRLSAANLLGAFMSLLAVAYLLNLAGSQTRLMLFLQNWSTLLRSGNSEVVSSAIAIAPYLLGVGFIVLCLRMLRPDYVARRPTR